MTRARGMALGALMALTTGCMTYRGPYGVEAALERKLGVELHRELGIKLVVFYRRARQSAAICRVEGDRRRPREGRAHDRR